MKFDDNHAIHLERVDQNYPHLDILRQINEEAFPKNERKDLSIYLNQSAEPVANLHAVVDGDVPVGFTIWYNFGKNYVFWMYLAIDSRYRNRKYGTKTERLIFDDILKGKIIFGAVEALNPNAENFEQRISRIKFHERNGFHLFDKIFDLGTAGQYQFVCTDPSVSVDALENMILSAMKRTQSK